MSYEEFLEFVYRVAEFVYDESNYEDAAKETPPEVQELFTESMYVKFRETLKRIVHVGELVRLSKLPPQPAKSKKQTADDDPASLLATNASLEIIDPDEPAAI